MSIVIQFDTRKGWIFFNQKTPAPLFFGAGHPEVVSTPTLMPRQ